MREWILGNKVTLMYGERTGDKIGSGQDVNLGVWINITYKRIGSGK